MALLRLEEAYLRPRGLAERDRLRNSAKRVTANEFLDSFGPDTDGDPAHYARLLHDLPGTCGRRTVLVPAAVAKVLPA